MTFTPKTLALSIACALTLGTSPAFAQKAGNVNLKETVKIAWIDPLSGLMAPVGTNQLKSSVSARPSRAATRSGPNCRWPGC